jgi:hypothetical protein
MAISSAINPSLIHANEPYSRETPSSASDGVSATYLASALCI